MATMTTNTDFLSFPAPRKSRLLGEIGKNLQLCTESGERLREIERLYAKSDAELSAMGLTRDDIVRGSF